MKKFQLTILFLAIIFSVSAVPSQTGENAPDNIARAADLNKKAVKKSRGRKICRSD